MLTWFGPGRIRQIVYAARNSSSVSQRRSSTMTLSAQADSPPPRLAIAILRKARLSAARVTASPGRGAGGAAPAGSGSLMEKVRVVGQLAVVRVRRDQGIGRVPVVRVVPVPVEHLDEPLENQAVVDDDPQLAPEIEGAPVDVHGADQGAPAVGEQELGVQLGLLLAAHLHAEPPENAQGREGVGDIGVADPVLASA